jgi:hypothetical protein
MRKFESLARYKLERSAAVDRRQLLSSGMSFAGTFALLGYAGSSRADTTPRGGEKKVYAHWHWFPTSFDNRPPEVDLYADYLSPEGSRGKLLAEGGYIRERPLPRRPRPEPNWAVLDMHDEIKAAQDIGLDGFQFNIGSIEPDSIYLINLRNMLEAANAAPARFEVALSLDALILKDTPVDVIAAAVLKLAENPSVARHSDGRLLLGAFAPEQWEIGRWKAVLQKLATGGLKVYFFPTFLDVAKVFEFLDLIDGASMWGVDRLSEIKRLKEVARQVKQAGKAWLRWCGRKTFDLKTGGLRNPAIASCFAPPGKPPSRSTRMW